MFAVKVNQGGLVDACARVMSVHETEAEAEAEMNYQLSLRESEGYVVVGTYFYTPNSAGGYGMPHDEYYFVEEQ